MAWFRTHTHTVSENSQVIQFKGAPTIHQEYYFDKHSNPKDINYNVPKGNYFDTPPCKVPIPTSRRIDTKAMEFRKLPMQRDSLRSGAVHHPQYEHGSSGKEYQGRAEMIQSEEERRKYATASPPGGAYVDEKYTGLTIDSLAAARKYGGVIISDDKKLRYPCSAPLAYDSVDH